MRLAPARVFLRNHPLSRLQSEMRMLAEGQNDVLHVGHALQYISVPRALSNSNVQYLRIQKRMKIIPLVQFGSISGCVVLREFVNGFAISDHTDSPLPKKRKFQNGSFAMATRDIDLWSLQNISPATRQNTSHHFIMWIYPTKSSTKGPFSLKFATRKEISDR